MNTPLEYNPPVDTEQLARNWYSAKQSLDYWKDQEEKLRKQVIDSAFKTTARNGTKRVNLNDGVKLKAVFNNTLKLDKDPIKEDYSHLQAALQGVNPQILNKLIKWEPKVSTSEYKKLTDSEQTIVDKVLTIKPGTPQLDIEFPKQEA